jgi:STE24 endopeptidase
MTARTLRPLLAVAAIMAPLSAYAATKGFDPDAATQAYLATLKGAARAKSDAYFEGGYWLLLWGTLAAVLSELLVLNTGLSARFRDWAERATKRRFPQSMLYALPYGAFNTLVLLPWTIYTGFWRERQYDLMNQSFGGWIGEQGISFLISTVIGALVIAIVIWGISKSPKHWWIWGSGVTAAFLALMILVTPVFISPLFNTYSEMPKGPLRDRIVAMAASQNVPAEHIYVFDQSKQHKRISANVSGLGPTIRISLNDNLLTQSTPDEVAAVMGHELGHYVLGHVWKLVLSFTLIFTAAFWLASRIVPWLLSRYGGRWKLRGVSDVAAIPVYAMVLSIFMLVATPFTNSIVRTNESQADAFGLDVARAPDGFASAAMKLSVYRKIEPGPLEEIVFFDHPSGKTRVLMSMQWKAKHLAEVEAKAR